MTFLKKTLRTLAFFIWLVATYGLATIAVDAVLPAFEISHHTGTSMLPTIDHNYSINTPVTNRTDLSVGDIVSYRAYNGEQPISICHRIVAVRGGGQSFILKGDNNDSVDCVVEGSGNYTSLIPRSSITHKIAMVIPHAFDPIFENGPVRIGICGILLIPLFLLLKSLAKDIITVLKEVWTFA